MNYPVSIKGILLGDNGVVLVRNHRHEWELPGGRIEPGETPRQCLTREMKEELGVDVNVVAPIDSYLFEVIPEQWVFIVTYSCVALDQGILIISDEHIDIAEFPPSSLPESQLPVGYLRSIQAWARTVAQPLPATLSRRTVSPATDGPPLDEQLG